MMQSNGFFAPPHSAQAQLISNTFLIRANLNAFGQFYPKLVTF